MKACRVPAERAVGCGQRRASWFARRTLVRNAADVGDAAAILEVPVDRQRQHATLGETAIQLLKLGPAGDQPRREAFGVKVFQSIRPGNDEETGVFRSFAPASRPSTCTPPLIAVSVVALHATVAMAPALVSPAS